MNKSFVDFLNVLKKNRIVIYILLAIIVSLQIISPGNEKAVRIDEPQHLEITEVSDNNIPVEIDIKQIDTLQEDNKIAQSPTAKNDEEVKDSIQEANQETDEPDLNFNKLLLMLGLILGFFVAKRYGWLDKLFPKVVIFKVSHYKSKTNGNLILKVFIINKTNNSLSFNNPVLCFFKGSQKREFTIKNIGGQNYFPITLTPGVGHKFNIDVQAFYDKVQGLKEYKTIRMEISTNTGKTYKSIKWPVWLKFKKI